MVMNKDFIASIMNWELWGYFAWQEIKLRYRRSKIGPFWITLSMAIFCVSLGIVYSKIFKMDMKEYFPFLSIGFVFWGLISGMLCDMPNIYIENAAYIKDIKINPLDILFKVITRHIIIFLHNFIIIIAIYVYFNMNPGFIAIIALPGMILVLMNLITIGVVLSLFGTRFRDVSPIIQSLTQMLFFITPITWLPRLLPSNSWVIKINPFVYFLDLSRSPLLGELPSMQSWIVAICTLMFFSSMATLVYNRKSHCIPFWV
jgi:ABC-type polysaccharide/polyol phosphate export permease